MTKTDYQNEVINRIRQLRIDSKISQIRLAEIIDVSHGLIGNIESPKFSHKYTLKQLFMIAGYFDKSIPYLLTGEDTPLDAESLIKAIIRYEE